MATTNAIDDKAMLLYDKYGDNHFVATTVREMEQMRNSATNRGLFATVAIFGLNEVARLALRSRKSRFACRIASHPYIMYL